MIGNRKTYHTKFIFSIASILPDLEPDVQAVREALASQGVSADEELLVAAWVTYQLERHLFLNIQAGEQRGLVLEFNHLIDPRFFHSNVVARDLMLSQMRPVLTHRETVPYTDRICLVQVRLPDVDLYFL